ncbi:flagellar hook capping FlgD N-terminal domain-containing protein [Gammaproteobacteria bacterium AS21]
MSDINSTNIYQQINSAYQSADTTTGQSKSQEDSELFLQLMIAQLQNQDPTSPADSQAFMEQIATMNQVESTNNLTNAVEQMSESLLTSQSALQASSMVGQTVLISTDKTISDSEGAVDGLFALANSTDNIQLTVKNASGVVVDTVDLGKFAGGNNDFSWQGDADSAGEEYSFEAHALNSETGTYERIDTYLNNQVTSVTLGQNGVGMMINTAVGSTALSNVLRISI